VVTMREKLARLGELHRESELGGGQAAWMPSTSAASSSARERPDLVLAADSFVEMDRFVTGRALASMPGRCSRALASWVEPPCRSTSWPSRSTA
jgi:acetyl-CoA carboxylase carboxyltransferase component